MKNIHLLRTDKPSRIRLGNNKNFVIANFEQSSIRSKNDSYTNQHIYITSDEFIEEGDFGLNLSTKNIVQYDGIKALYSYYKKIILTTDQDLIKDGVQAIDDEFLEWFVKNPNCEFVKASELSIFDPDTNESAHCKWEYDLPQEEPKQETLEEDDLDSIENKIIECLNKADNKLNANDFNRLAESIIDYIDEISRSKSY
jgi:hypothetical protein